MPARPRIALIHATPVAIDPVREAFEAGWPDAEVSNILDDSLTTDMARSGALTEALAARIDDLARYARRTGADGILFTCSAFGRAIEAAAARLDVPVLKPNEAMYEAALAAGPDIAMIATFGPAVAGMEQEFAEAAARRDPAPRLRSLVVTAAMEALRAGDADTHNRLVAEEAEAIGRCDALMLAHFSTARAATAVRARTNVPVLTSPESAVARLRALVVGAGPELARTMP